MLNEIFKIIKKNIICILNYNMYVLKLILNEVKFSIFRNVGKCKTMLTSP